MFTSTSHRRRLVAPFAKQSGAVASVRHRVLLAAAALAVLFLFHAGAFSYLRSCTEHGDGGTARCKYHPSKNVVPPPAFVSHGILGPRSGLPPHPENRPHYDLVVAVLVVGGESQEAQDEVARVRRVYARYGSQVVPDGGSATPLTLRVIFVVGRAGLSDDAQLPETGLLLGDFFHLDVREGYTHLSDKTKAMMGLTEHLR